jgi:hypothetical protein
MPGLSNVWTVLTVTVQSSLPVAVSFPVIGNVPAPSKLHNLAGVGRHGNLSYERDWFANFYLRPYSTIRLQRNYRLNTFAPGGRSRANTPGYPNGIEQGSV